MIYSIKKLLFKIFGLSTYLKILHVGFYFLFDLGLLKNNNLYKYNYFVKNLIKPDDVVIDIGANLGYFSKIFSRLAYNGKVICIEPMPPFFTTLNWALKNKKNCILYNNALGDKNEKVTMNLPFKDGFFSTGLAHVENKEDKNKESKSFEATIVKGSELLSNLSKIDYIKCDIEGYEDVVLPEMKPILERFKPIIQLEIGLTEESIVYHLLKELGYQTYYLSDNKLVKGINAIPDSGDYLFIHANKIQEVRSTKLFM